MLSADIGTESCSLCQTDSSTAAGWLRKSNFADKLDEAVQLTTARQLANLLIETKSCLYSQWFPGKLNTISDSLSRVFHLPSPTLSNLLVTHVLEQTPFSLTIQSMPKEIDSWLTLLLCNQLQKEPWLKAPMPSRFALGIGTVDTYYPSDSMMTYTSTISPEVQNIRSSVPLLSQSEMVDFALGILNISSPRQIRPQA
jgi:hypothetical protein